MDISKRKLKSYQRAELVCRELRFQLGGKVCDQDLSKAVELLISWMRVTGKVKYIRPNHENATTDKDS